MVTGMEVHSRGSRILSYQVERFKILPVSVTLLFLKYFHDMNREEFDSLEIEANAHTPVISSHHLHIPRGYDSRRLMEIVEKEALDQLEPGQAPIWTGYLSVNTLR